ncbi:MAG TPA: hypothetical protein VJ385_17620 [Fibrobacteria bacterium]|nr:hypothetical protein [Fibrobacteria bacterium]
MSEIQAIATGLSSIRTAIDIARGLKEIDRSIKDSEFKLRLVQLMDELVEVKESLVSARESNLDLKSELNALRERLELKSSLQWDGSKYWLDKDGRKTGPYCQKCNDENEKLIRLQFNGSFRHHSGYWNCLTCGARFSEAELREDPIR